MNFRLHMVALTAVMMAGLSTSAAAEETMAGYDRVSARVSHAGLDLTTSAGRKELEKRMREQVRRMCTPGDPTHPLSGAIRRECIDLAQPMMSQQIEIAVARAERKAAESPALAGR